MNSNSNAISNVIYQFANSFDRKDWLGLAATLQDEIECDYQDMRAHSGVFSKGAYVAARQAALAALHTQHLLSNLEINCVANKAFCRANAIIYRCNDVGTYFNSHVMYDMQLCQLAADNWRIQKITQQVLWHEGDASIHIGVK